RTMRVSRYGSELQSKVDEINAQLNTKYGKSKNTSFLRSGALWKENHDFMMALRQKERFYSYTFDASSGMQRVDGVRSIFVAAAALSDSQGYVVVEFSFDNEKQCDEAIKGDSGKAF
ncbi:MAG: hypothetical protein JNJ97_10000, partial [Alphaproteobacteria bacterium]|nr:hypothetical protein [Alphaproteobacteria bacterium]